MKQFIAVMYLDEVINPQSKVMLIKTIAKDKDGAWENIKQKKVTKQVIRTGDNWPDGEYLN